MRRCSYHTYLRQNAVFHHFSRQIALIHYSEPLNHRSTRGLLAKPFKKISKFTYTASRFSLLTSAKLEGYIKRVTPQHFKEFIVYFSNLFYNDV